MSNINLRDFQTLNAARCEEVFHPVDSWSLSDWSNALAGEAGEVCGETKKIKRGDYTLNQRKKELGNEIADVICYCTLLASKAQIDIVDALIEKFNEVSNKKGSHIKL